MQIASSAAAVEIPPFTPQQGVRIETDPKAASAAPGPTSGDDDSQIAMYSQQLRVRQIVRVVEHYRVHHARCTVTSRMQRVTFTRCQRLMLQG
jgi:hypothetical protein